MKLEFAQNVLKKHIKFHENPSNGSWVVPWKRQTDSHDESNTARGCSVKISNKIGFNWLYQISDHINIIIS